MLGKLKTVDFVCQCSMIFEKLSLLDMPTSKRNHNMLILTLSYDFSGLKLNICIAKYSVYIWTDNSLVLHALPRSPSESGKWLHSYLQSTIYLNYEHCLEWLQCSRNAVQTCLLPQSLALNLFKLHSQMRVIYITNIINSGWLQEITLYFHLMSGGQEELKIILHTTEVYFHVSWLVVLSECLFCTPHPCFFFCTLRLIMW